MGYQTGRLSISTRGWTISREGEKPMRKLKGYAIWAMAALLSVFMIGCTCQDDECGDGDGWNRHRPTVTFVTPANTETGVPINRKITATFSEAMDPATINTATFTVTEAGTRAVTGTVTYDGTNHIAIFTPDSDLTPNTTYIGTITTGAKNPAGVSLAIPFVWIFTTGAPADTTQPEVIVVSPA